MTMLSPYLGMNASSLRTASPTYSVEHHQSSFNCVGLWRRFECAPTQLAVSKIVGIAYADAFSFALVAFPVRWLFDAPRRSADVR